MKQVLKKLFWDSRYLVHWQHRIFYFFIFFLFFYFLYFHQQGHASIDVHQVVYSLGRTVFNGFVIAILSSVIAVFFIFLYLIQRFKFIKGVLGNIFIFPDIVYLAVLLFWLSPIDATEFFLIFSFVHSYSLFQMLSIEIDELENKDFINALYLSGVGRFNIALKHIFPMLFIPLFLLFLETITWFIIMEFILSFISVFHLYDTPSIGAMLFELLKAKNLEYFSVLLMVVMLFIFEFNYIINHIKIRFEVSIKE